MGQFSNNHSSPPPVVSLNFSEFSQVKNLKKILPVFVSYSWGEKTPKTNKTYKNTQTYNRKWNEHVNIVVSNFYNRRKIFKTLETQYSCSLFTIFFPIFPSSLWVFPNYFFLSRNHSCIEAAKKKELFKFIQPFQKFQRED